MEPPSGGPVDTKRPYVTAAYPAPGSRNVPRELRARIAFSEWIAPDAAKSKVYLSPPPARKLRTRLSGNILEVTVSAPLDSNTTYVLGVLGSIRDLHELPLEGAVQLTFSTGPDLDSGRLSGREIAFMGKPAPGGFAALYPRGAPLRTRFGHLTRIGDSAVVPADQPDPLRERPAYIASADSLGRFGFQGVRPGAYALLGFQDINGDLIPGIGQEALAFGPTVEVSADSGEFRSLTLLAYDTVPVRLMEARWAGESLRGNLSSGTVRLKLNRPAHPIQSLRREAYAVRKLHSDSIPRKDSGPLGKPAKESGVPVPVQDVCLNPATGEIELSTPPLEADGRYLAMAIGLRDRYGNPADTAQASAEFRVSRTVDTAKPEMIFQGPPRISGEIPRLPADNLIPGRGITVYYPRLLTDSALGALRARLIVKIDTVAAAFTLVRRNHHEFLLNLSAPVALKGQRLSLALKPDSGTTVAAAAAPGAQPGKTTLPPGRTGANSGKAGADSARASGTAPSAPVPVANFNLADTAKLGTLVIPQAPSAYGSRIVARGLSSSWEATVVTPPAQQVTLDSLPAGKYSVDYFRDANGDGLWTPGGLSPWTVQEPFARWADSVEVRTGTAENKTAGGLSAPAARDSARTPDPQHPLAWPPAF